MSNLDDPISEAELALLTPEERSALEPEDLKQEDQGNTESDAEDIEASDDAVSTDAVDEQPIKDEPDVKEANDPAGIASEPIQYDISAPSDAKQQLESIANAKAELLGKLDNMEIELADYHTALNELISKETDIKFSIREAELVQKINQQNSEKAWAETCDSFITSHVEYQDNPVMLNLLNKNVIALASDPANQNLTGLAVLNKAHKAALEEADIQFEKMAKALGKTVATTPKQTEAKKPSVKLPQTLSGLPNAEPVETGGDPFAALDRLSGAELEKALSNMTQAQRDKYLGI